MPTYWRAQEIDAAIIGFTPLVKRIAWKVSKKLPASIEVDDLIQSGMIGLLDAATRFDVLSGVPFESFAYQRIQGAILDDLRFDDWVPRSVRRARGAMFASKRKVEQSLGRAATPKEIASDLNITIEEFERIRVEADACIQESINTNEGELRQDLVYFEKDPSVNLEESQFDKALVFCIEQLPQRKRLLMDLRYQRDMGFKEIGELFGVTESRCCQLHAEIIVWLRQRLRPWVAP